MRIFAVLMLGAALVVNAGAQTNVVMPKVGILCGPEEADAGDLLTAELSKNNGVQLLERAQMEKVLAEQGLSMANGDEVKVGRILGADGLLHLEVVQGATETNLMVRLMAVKPGVVLADWDFRWPVQDMATWSGVMAARLEPYLPKLTVLSKDAIPISVVNLRSATASSGAEQTERVLQSLVIERLSRERQLFVLERQKLEKLEEEKNFSADETAFWNGAYLLEGVSDQNGYSKDTITINARLTPAKGGTPVLLEASGSRTNFSEVVNALAAKIMTALQVSPTAKEWNAADEADQYFKEAQWALRWGVYKEAEAAADSAWALGKNDEECAMARIRAYMMEAQAETVNFNSSGQGVSPPCDANGNPVGPVPSDEDVKSEVRVLEKKTRLIAWKATPVRFYEMIDYEYEDRMPVPGAIDCALHGLGLYYDFGRTAADHLSAGEDGSVSVTCWKDPLWYELGLDDLTVGAKVLQEYCLLPEAQTGQVEKLAELRMSARQVTELTEKCLESTNGQDRSEEKLNLLKCKIQWGCFWQEQPEGGVDLYRQMMKSPMFWQAHSLLWNRDMADSRLAGWNEDDRERIPQVWTNFVQELEGSTNLLWHLEGDAIKLATITDEAALGELLTNFYGEIISNRDALVAYPFDAVTVWDGNVLLQAGGNSDLRNKLEVVYFNQFRGQLEAINGNYREQKAAEAEWAATFTSQEKYLRENTPFGLTEFWREFREKKYTTEQAREILPLIVAYKSNLLAQATNANAADARQFKNNARQVDFFLQGEVERMVDSTGMVGRAQRPHPKPPPAESLIASERRKLGTNGAPATVYTTTTNLFVVDKFLEVPYPDIGGQAQDPPRVVAHQWIDGRLVLDLDYAMYVITYDTNGYLISQIPHSFPVIAILDPASEQWQVLVCPEFDRLKENHYYHHTTLWRREVYSANGGRVSKCSLSGGDWSDLDIPKIGDCELFTVNDHLYAANGDQILEITEGGNATRVLASSRRQPPVAALDTEPLGTPILVSGAGNTLRVVTQSAVFSWDGTNWERLCAVPVADSPPDAFKDGVLVHNNEMYGATGIWFLGRDDKEWEYYLGQPTKKLLGRNSEFFNHDAGPIWEMPSEYSPEARPAAVDGTNFFLLLDHFKSSNEMMSAPSGAKVLLKDGYHAALLCFNKKYRNPSTIFLRYSGQDGTEPVTRAQIGGASGPSGWMQSVGGHLYLGIDGTRSYDFPKAGVWSISGEEVAVEMDRQEAVQAASLATSQNAADAVAKELLEKYDLNHDGKIDGDEKEAALVDEKYIQSRLGEIDANGNGLLDLGELKWFDANNNNRLETNEVTGIITAEGFLAAKLMAKFGNHKDGHMTWQEYHSMVMAVFDPATQSHALNERPDANHDGFVDVPELQAYLIQVTLHAMITTKGPGGNPLMIDNGYMAQSAEDTRDEIRRMVNGYWRRVNGPPSGSSGAFIQRPAGGAASNP